MRERFLALTFDDGPSPDTMPRILDLLARYGASATFFIWGGKITPQTAPVLRRAIGEGHQLGNHSMGHLHMESLSRTEALRQVEELQQLLKQDFGAEPELFRPPYLEFSREMQEAIPLPFITGTSIRDWTDLTDASQRLRLAKEAAGDGAILLMHCFEGNTATVQALEQLLPWLTEQGYRLTTVSDLFARKGIVPQAGSVWDCIK